MVMIAAININTVLLSTTNCSTWTRESSGDPSYEVSED